MYIFNPSHELALAADTQQYTPPRLVQMMENDLRDFPQLYTDADGRVVIDGSNVDGAYGDLHVWGWNMALKARLLRQGLDERMMPTDAEIAGIRRLASREYCVDYARKLYEHLTSEHFVENRMKIIASYQPTTPSKSPQGETSPSEWHSPPRGRRRGAMSWSGAAITKTLWSSSGRGVRIVRDGKFPKPPYLLDCFYDKKLDFAMEFTIGDDGAHYLGLSVFEASADGKYDFNYVRSQSDLLQMILDKGIEPETIGELVEKHKTLLTQELADRYRGLVGIDMMVVDGGLIHPCVELNLRMNMGVAAILLYNKYGDGAHLAVGNTHGFQVHLEGDRLFIDYSK